MLGRRPRAMNLLLHRHFDEAQRGAIALVLGQRLGHASTALRDLLAERERFVDDHADPS